MKKRIFGAAALFSAALVSAVYGSELKEYDASIYVDGIEVNTPAYINESNSTYIPLRGVFEAMDCQVDYIPETKTAEIAYSDTILSFSQYDTENTATVNGSIYLPLRAVAEELGFSVTWSEEENIIYIESALKYEEYTTEETAEIPLVGEDSDFAARLDALKNKDENYIISPLSLKYALALAANGADEETKEEILNILGISDLESYNAEAKAYIESSSPEYEEAVEINPETGEEETVLSPIGTGLTIANSLWLNEDYIEGGDFSDEFNETAEESYSAEAKAVTEENAAEEINNWCREASGGKISEIAEDTDFIASIINAVYFNGKWTAQFDKDSTKTDIFTNADGTETETDFMNNVAYFPYYADKNIKLISLPYNYSNISMYIALTDEENIDVTKYADKTEEKKVKVKMPKFTTETALDAVDLLKALGMEKAFDETAYHFKYMFNDTVNNAESIYISDVIQKAYIKLDEEGTEAAAITSVTAVGSLYEPEPEEVYEFTADKPFTYFIRDNSVGEILFIGRFARA